MIQTSHRSRKEPRRGMMRTTVVDLAREAGVSTATVDRVLNNRQGVKSRTRDHVLSVAERLGYIDEPAAAGQTPRSRAGHVGHRPSERHEHVPGRAARPFRRRLSSAERRAGSHPYFRRLRSRCSRQHAGWSARDRPRAWRSWHSITLRCERPSAGLPRQGCPVVTLVSDISQVPRLGYVGIDNRAAGRLAGHLLSRFMGPGSS